MEYSINKLTFAIDELSNNLFAYTNSVKAVCNKLEICNKELIAAVEKFMETVSTMESDKTMETQSKKEKFSIDTTLGVLGFFGITFPNLMDELSAAIISLLAGGISIPNLLLSIGSFLITTPIGMEIGISILDGVEAWIKENFGQGVVDAIGASLNVGYAALLGAVLGGGPIGALIGAGVGGIVDWFYYDEYTSKIGDAIMKNVFNFDTRQMLLDSMMQSFSSVDDADDFLEIGKYIVSGIVAGFNGALATMLEPWTDLFLWVWEGICDVFGINSPAEEMKPLGENILLGIVQGFEDTFEIWTESIQKFWDEELKSWFSLETWQEFGESIKSGLSEKWTEFTEWWKDTGVYTWWEEDVAPRFAKKQWTGFGENIRTGLSEKWTEFTVWWKTTGLYNWWNEDIVPWFTKEQWTWSGIKDGLKQAFNNAIDSVKQIWNRFASWLNDKLTISWDTFSIGDYEIIPAGTFKLGEIPTFYDGGFPEDSTLFFAGEYGVPELLGTIGGKTAVASGSEITGIADAVYSTGYEEASLLKSAVNLLKEIANKEMSVNIGDREIARANYRGQKSLGTRLITEF